ncbi:GNAT family N-acetyltransferase [Shewanella sp. SW36]|uniref:GNAT family N-acetyltransferase n=1 Tax=Shewanella TaxID=22 RepID=UPI0021DAFE31|nr:MULTISPECIES: GNAT family N-acetyltransferase [unclassified Shewanella]MCU7974995.1 GNAT family N-acetyltransferase [Shewanella sp. SW36]MCU7990384.1 GNAT family N-acetyltransferase [Shewanella sp. SW1]MCU8016941.1 GNAT family N-acetyltransferase [Shewanella sp. SM72]MCU8052842.1 GNAT family N-acetyltransferase [Shewanella sp. SM43]
MRQLILAFASSMSDISASAWNAAMGEANPFCRHEFLLALEQSRSACTATGWTPRHLCVFDAGDTLNDVDSKDKSLSPLAEGGFISVQTAKHFNQFPLIAVMPLYQKSHSYGEYVFDWAWAEAYERHGLDYYPKWVNAIPFTPVQGQRMGIHPEEERAEQLRVAQLLLMTLNRQLISAQDNLVLEEAILNQSGLGDNPISSWHSLFVTPTQTPLFESLPHSLLKRLGTQFHWHNRGYRDFNDFLAGFSSRKRKNILKERAQLQPFNLKFQFVEGEQTTASQWQTFIQCYQLTYLKRSGHRGYLTPTFFQQLGAQLAAQVLLLVVEDAKGEMVAGALYLKGENTRGQKCLYGRYWGTTVELDGLHFEACYYQGIQYCIEHEFQVFDAGAQGEHKVLRGFEPVAMYSYHNIAHLGFKAAIADFVEQETLQMQQYMAQMQDVLPYKKAPS